MRISRKCIGIIAGLQEQIRCTWELRWTTHCLGDQYIETAEGGEVNHVDVEGESIGEEEKEEGHCRCHVVLALYHSCSSHNSSGVVYVGQPTPFLAIPGFQEEHAVMEMPKPRPPAGPWLHINIAGIVFLDLATTLPLGRPVLIPAVLHAHCGFKTPEIFLRLG